MNFVTLKLGVALHFPLQLANHKSQGSDFGTVCLAITLSLADIFDEKEETTVLERVAFLLRLSLEHVYG